jgi:prepilin-type N-terminal cleavage/methylation domain-containing protein
MQKSLKMPVNPQPHRPTAVKAFTLSELLVSLSVLGLIAALTLPTIFNSVEQSRKKAVLKETVNILENVSYECAMEGMLRLNTGVGNDAHQCYQSKINFVKQDDVFANLANNTGSVTLQSGATISFNMGNTYTIIDYNGMQAPNTLGQDRVGVRVCYETFCSTSLFQNTKQHGKLAVDQTQGAENIALWNSIWQ